MTEQSAAAESQSLLFTLPPRSSPSHQQTRNIKSCCSLRRLCLTSKATVLVLLLTVVDGAAVRVVIYVSLLFMLLSTFDTNISLLLLLYLLMAVVYLVVYPINGFLADVCCGRFKTVILCLCLMVFSLVTVALVISILKNFYDVYNISYAIIGLIGFLTSAISSTGY